MGRMGRSPTGLAPRSDSAGQDGPQPPLPVFAYGTLLEESFVANLLEHPVGSRPGLLMGYRLARLGGEDGWPVLLAEEGGVIEGRLYRNLDRGDLARLDAYEGVGEGLYRRHRVAVQVGQGPDRTSEEAFVYIPTERTLRRYGLG
jgi:gamma-glutamylcyclotransferase (GGCT)/AIG2-like uncharacterized protein YtfP